MVTPGSAHLRVVVLDDYQRVARGFGPWDAVAGRIELDVVHEHLRGEALVGRLAGAAVVVAMRERTAFDAGLLAALPDLRLLVTTGPANAAIDVRAANGRGVMVCGTGIDVRPTAELTWGLILALARNLLPESQALRAGHWQTSIGVNLAGRRLGVLGLGRLGSQVAAVGAAFGMDVVAWSKNLQADTARARGVQAVEKDELLATSDVVTVHLVLSRRTRGLIGPAELALMKRSAYLVNTSRGPIIDEVALVSALHEGRIAGVALDVFDTEPLPVDSPLRSTPRTLLTPHLGYVTAETYQQFFGEAVEDIRAWLDGTPVRVVQPAPGSRPG